MKRVVRLVLLVLVSAFAGWVAMSAVSGPVRLGVRDSDAMCVLQLPAGQPIASANFTVAEQLDVFAVRVAPGNRKQWSKISVTGVDGLVFSATVRENEFGGGRDIKPGAYRLDVEQEPGGAGAKVYVSRQPLGVTGWQVFSRVFTGLVALSGVCAFAFRNSVREKRRLVSRLIFHYLLLAFLANVVYLFFHEGGHALPSILLGKFSFADSDFFGLNGHPSSGLCLYAEVTPWQRAIVSFGGPALPTLVGWTLFAVYRLARVKRLRDARPAADFFASGIVLMCVFPCLVLGAQLLGFAHDGDWHGFIQNVPGPLWLVKTVLWLAWGLNLAVTGWAAAAFYRAWRQHLAAITARAKSG